MFELIPKNTKIDFVSRRYLWMAISAVTIISSLVLFFTKGLNYGIDFTGGAEVQVHFSRDFKIADLRDVLERASFKNIIIQQLGEGSRFLVKFRGDDENLQAASKRVEDAISTKIARSDFEIERADVVGPQAGSQLRKSGFLAMFYTLLFILIYVGVRFDYRFAPGAVLALFHDSMITLGVFVLTQKEFSLQTVAAILTIIGYSNNDTIIVYDRVRETIKAYPGRPFIENINRSINETLSRTILTSVLTLMVVTSLMVYGGGVIHDFAFTMFIGILVGTYSSIFIASPILILLTEYQEKRKLKNAI